ncbi:MAG TPA: putative Ig domain-containing protein [Chitinophagaceae bacterium]|nr:putative Ig domain-containing protein [Chitinophagaceae bacterium]
MKRITVLVCILFTLKVSAQQNITLSSAKFITGDSPSYKELSFSDNSWANIKPMSIWEEQGYSDYNGYAWYRFHFTLPSSLKKNSYWKDSLRIIVGKVDDVDETFLNGVKIGQTGSLPSDNGGYAGQWDVVREYHIAANSPELHWDKENVLSVRVYDGGGGGGIFNGAPVISMMDIIDGINVTATAGDNAVITIANQLTRSVPGTVTIQVKDGMADKITSSSSQNITLPALQSFTKTIVLKGDARMEISATFKEKNTGKIKSITITNKYILTPPAPLTPKINSAKVAGVRPGSPFLYKIAATGQKPLQYSVANLPYGLLLDTINGVISGTLTDRGDYPVKLTVRNSLGKDERTLTIKVGDLLALTPPMGWNSWNCWGLSVSEEKVKSSAQALIDKGLIDHGWTYMNIDDGWEQPKRAADGTIIPNAKFPDMKGLGDWLHARGLKFGIYSSPGTTTCGGYLASYQHEMQDATSYASWGIDYLKYDWCSYGDVYAREKDTSLAAYMRPYQVMQKALKAQPRDIHYSLCQYGMKDVWKWGAKVDGNTWRTTGDITDTWQSLSSIGFSQTVQYPYAEPGHWNDPDMLIVGKVGWGDQLHDTRLTPDEQYTHISLWCLLSSPLLIGCDISKMDDFTLNLLSNDEVLALDQDVLGKQAQQKLKKDDYQVWVKELEDGSKAVGIFNMSDKWQNIELNWQDIGLGKTEKVRDLWRQKDLGAFGDIFKTRVAPHGVTLIKVT